MPASPPEPAFDRNKPDDQFTPLAKEPTVDIGLLHSARSGTALNDSDYDFFAGLLSYPYRAEGNPGKKQAMLESLKREMGGKVQAFKANPYVTMQLPFYLGVYDSATRAFPLIAGQLYTTLSWLKDGRLPYWAGMANYTLRIRNAGKFGKFIVSDEDKARDFNSFSPQQRGGIATVYLFAQNASGAGQSRTITAEIVRVKLTSGDGEFLGELRSD